MGSNFRADVLWMRRNILCYLVITGEGMCAEEAADAHTTRVLVLT